MVPLYILIRIGLFRLGTRTGQFIRPLNHDNNFHIPILHVLLHTFHILGHPTLVCDIGTRTFRTTLTVRMVCSIPIVPNGWWT